jgi:hypothetical protein
VDVYGTREEDIVLYGQSVGSGPTLDLAVRLDHIRAVILHSAILSGLRVMYSVKKTYWFDIYKVCLLIEVSKINNLHTVHSNTYFLFRILTKFHM